jgi:recombination protein RecT
VSSNPLTGYEFDWSVESDEIIGYVAYFKLLNGFEAYNYMSVEQVKAHAAKYSQSYQYDLKDKKTNSNWSKNFDSMALKTLIKLLLSKFAPLSVEMQSAFQADQSVVKDVEAQEFDYIDNSIDSVQSEPAALEPYDEKKFNSMLNDWSKAILGGKTTAAKMISKIESRNTITSEQRARIEAIENVIDAATPTSTDDDGQPF